MASRGLTLAEAAEVIGCDPSYPSLIARGHRRVGIEVGVKIERATSDWAEGPIRCSEWVDHDPTLTPAVEPQECA